MTPEQMIERIKPHLYGQLSTPERDWLLAMAREADAGRVWHNKCCCTSIDVCECVYGRRLRTCRNDSDRLLREIGGAE